VFVDRDGKLKSFVVPFADGIGGLETSGGRPANFKNYPSLPAVESSSIEMES